MLPFCFIWVTGGASLGLLVLHVEDIVTGGDESRVYCSSCSKVAGWESKRTAKLNYFSVISVQSKWEMT